MTGVKTVILRKVSTIYLVLLILVGRKICNNKLDITSRQTLIEKERKIQEFRIISYSFGKRISSKSQIGTGLGTNYVPTETAGK